MVVEIVDEECTGKNSKIDHSSVEAWGCVKNRSDRKYLINHHPFDITKVYYTGNIHNTYEINVYINIFDIKKGFTGNDSLCSHATTLI